ncbi:MAG: glycerol-3-phosphate acyltransferase [Eubacteriales bacterium]|nr:glycerol-3-phosphate acyltransferase [Eubacteriales bacterium]
MILYWALLLIIAMLSYGIGSISTTVLASNYVFRTRLSRLGRGNVWFSNFRRVYGLKGFLKLLIVELVKDVIPILLGGLILNFKGHADVGFIFAGVCMLLGRLYPLFSDFHGCHATVAMALVAGFAAPSAGIAAAVVGLLVTVILRYLSLGAVTAALTAAAVALLTVDDVLIRNLIFVCAGLELFRHIPSLFRILAKREERLSYEEDLSYKLDEDF